MGASFAIGMRHKNTERFHHTRPPKLNKESVSSNHTNVCTNPEGPSFSLEKAQELLNPVFPSSPPTQERPSDLFIRSRYPNQQHIITETEEKKTQLPKAVPTKRKSEGLCVCACVCVCIVRSCPMI